MTKPATKLLLGLTLAFSAMFGGGCRPQLPPDEDAIIDYFRNARLFHHRFASRSEGRVRRVWPAGQEYVNAVLKADAELQKALYPLRLADTAQLLPSAEDPRWLDTAEYAGWLGLGTEIITKGLAPTRQELLDELGEAIEQTPAGLGLDTPAAKAAFVTRVWDALAIHDVSLRNGDAMAPLVESGTAHLGLFKAIESCSEDFGTSGTGLHFKSEACQRNVDQAYQALAAVLDKHREDFLAHATAQLADTATRLSTIDKHKNEREYDYLIHKRIYFRDELEAIPKDLRGLIKAANEELEELTETTATAKPEQAPKLDAKIAFFERRIERLKHEERTWQNRVAKIIADAGPAPADE